MTNANLPGPLPDWWQREKQRRQFRVLIFLLLLLALIGYFYYTNYLDVSGTVSGVSFNTAKYIAFVRQEANGNFGVFAIRMDGTDERRLTPPDDNSNKSHPVWTMDGKSLYYASNRNDNKLTQIYVLGDGAPHQITYGTGNKAWPIVSPDGQHMAFIVQGAIKTAYLSGKEVTQLLPAPSSGNEDSADKPGEAAPTGPYLSFEFSSDGSEVAGVQDISNDSFDLQAGMDANQAITILPAGSNKTIILPAPGREVSLSWEPNGKRLAASFTELRVPVAGAKPQAVDDPSVAFWQKKPAGKAGAEKTQLVSGIRIWDLSQRTPTAKNLFIGLGYSIEPKNIAWSPDGSFIAFEGWRLKSEGVREPAGIVVMKVAPEGDTSEGARVDEAHVNSVGYLVPATPQGKPQNPKWSPDGLHLLYELARPDGKRDICIINTDRTNLINLTRGKGDNFDAVWSPAK